MQFIKTIIFIFILFNITHSIKETEKCIINALNSSMSQDLLLSSHHQFTDILLNFNLLPSDIKQKLRNCKIDLTEELKYCEHKYGFDNCEECGMVIVPKCPLNFISIDCAICAKKCPEHTEVYSGGLLCAKPEMRVKEIYNDMEECQISHEECEQNKHLWLGQCDKGFEPIGNFLCGFKCPEGFEDQNDFCKPELIENFDFTFEDLA